jgi:hypothetical protein
VLFISGGSAVVVAGAVRFGQDKRVDVALSSSVCDGGYEPSHARCLDLSLVMFQAGVAV